MEDDWIVDDFTIGLKIKEKKEASGEESSNKDDSER